MASLNSLMSGGWEPDYGDWEDDGWDENDICETCPYSECINCIHRDLHQSPSEQVPVYCPPGQPVEEDELPF